MTKVVLLKFYSEIMDDSYSDGEGEHTGCGYPLTPIGKQFNSLKEAIQWFGSQFGYSRNIDDYEVEESGQRPVAYTSRQRADHSNEQNGGWMEPTEQEIESWKAGESKLYTENVYLIYCC
jgi:hypothetical protein